MENSHSQEKAIITPDFCKKLPKIELHAHLNGSIRLQTLKELSLKKNLPFPFDEHVELNITTGFKIFAQIHQTITEISSVRRITKEMMEDFEQQNCLYLEIRTTPKIMDGASSFDEYLDAILEEILQFNKISKMIVRLWLSIDRSKSLEQARSTVQLLEKYKSKPLYSPYILGLDFSGNPLKNFFSDFIEVFEAARQKGFKTVVHIAEADCEGYKKEAMDIFNFRPDRIGHFLFFDEELFELALETKIPLEVCPSSNMCTKGMKSLKEHHFGRFLKEKYSMSICTDDTGVLDTDLSKEMYNIFSSFEMGYKEVREFLMRSMQCIIEEDVRKEVGEKFLGFFKEYENIKKL